MVAEVTTMLSTLIGWVGTVISALVTGGETAGALNALLPLAMVAVACSVIFFAVKTIRSIIWGY